MIDWPKIEQVFLDMDGTLLDLYFDNHFWLEFVPQCYARDNDLPLQQARQILQARYEAVQGRMQWYCVDHWTQELGLDIADLKREMSHLIRLHPHVIEFLDALADSGRQRILITNAHQKSLALKMEKTALQGHFEHIVCAHDYGVPKEEKAFWQKLNQQLPFDPASSLFVDDSEAVLYSARDYGFGWLLGISQPDSKGPARHYQDFEAMDDFAQIMPIQPWQASTPKISP
ncbi:MAG: GMP/IMP nucleotidase [gamma proteobacterium symbiont of Bathyaustriella thionipta]|nr:GMP/IMP nucleotidase [gamma proteobacterium symbiont of Bathyaustriella thionipta]